MKARHLIAGAIAALMLSGAAQAHRQWMLPSSTTLSGNDSWVTVDAAVSNDVFYFEHNPMRTDTIAVTQPDGTQGKIENAATGKYRSTFDVHLDKPGTWRIASVTKISLRLDISAVWTLVAPAGMAAARFSLVVPRGRRFCSPFSV